VPFPCEVRGNTQMGRMELNSRWGFYVQDMRGVINNMSNEWVSGGHCASYVLETALPHMILQISCSIQDDEANSLRTCKTVGVCEGREDANLV